VWACEEHVGEYVPAMRAATRAMDERFISAVLLLRTQRERERERERHAPTKHLRFLHAPGNARIHSAPYAPGEFSYLPLHHSPDTAATAH